MKGTTVPHEQGGSAARLYAIRENTPKRPRCIKCQTKLLLVRLKDGYVTCYGHDSEDPKHGTFREAHQEGQRGRGRPHKYAGPFMPDGGRKTRRLRQEAGLTLRELAMHIGVGDSTLQKWETGTDMTVEAFRAAERACGEEMG